MYILYCTVPILSRDGIYKKEGDKTGMDGWMDGWMDVAVVITLESYLSTGTSPIYCHRDYLVCCDNIGYVMCLLISRILRLSPRQHSSIHPSIHPSLSCLLPFYTIEDFSFTCLLPFFGAHYILKLIVCGIYIGSSYVLLFLYAVLLELSYVCMPTIIAAVANMGQL